MSNKTEKNKAALRCLSMLARQQPFKTDAERAANNNEGLKLAKEVGVCVRFFLSFMSVFRFSFFLSHMCCLISRK
jgi:hypothetical protein